MSVKRLVFNMGGGKSDIDPDIGCCVGTSAKVLVARAHPSERPCKSVLMVQVPLCEFKVFILHEVFHWKSLKNDFSFFFLIFWYLFVGGVYRTFLPP